MDAERKVVTLADILTEPATVAGLREQGPVHRAVLPDGTAVWVVIGYDEAAAALSDPRLSVAAMAAAGVIDAGKLTPVQRDGLLRGLTSTDPPDHTRLRRLVSTAFAARQVGSMRPWISGLTDKLIDGFAPAGRVELMSQLALPLPMLVISELLGIPEADRPRFREWSHALISGMGTPDFPLDSALEFLEFLRVLCADKREHPDEGLISALIRARDGAEALSEDELTSMVFLMVIAGHDTTVGLIGNGVYLLLNDPEQLEAVRADPSRLPAAIEEFLRMESPVPIGTFRAAVDSFELAGTRIAAGDLVAISLQSANLSPAQFTEPERLDPGRSQGRHLAFGHGIHYCLGAPLARLEAQAAIGALLRRFPALRLEVPAAELTWSRSAFVHRLDALPLALN
jgi:cytochrome P450